MFKKSLIILLTLILTFTSVACSSNKVSESKNSNTQVDSDNITDNIVSRVVKTEEGRHYIEYNGEPYLFYGTQIRIDNIRERYDADVTLIDKVFAQAKSDGFRTIVIPVKWYQIEPTEGDFDFSLVELYYNAIYKYDLTVQWLWFGTNVCAAGICTPKYMQNSDKYPKVKSPDGSGLFYDFTSVKTLEREKTALSKFMEFIAQRDIEKRCVMIQVNNEISHGGPTFDGGKNLWYTSEEYYFKYGWAGGQHYAIAEYLNKLGDVIHASDYNCVTRVNVMEDAWRVGKDIVEKLLDGTGIDIVGVDNYSKDWGEISEDIYLNEGNVFHFAEASITYDNTYTATKFLTEGLGYLSYTYHDYSPEESNFALYKIEGSDYFVPVDKEILDSVKAFNKMVGKVERELAYASAQGCVASFNYEHFLNDIDTTRTFGDLEVTFTNKADGYGMAFWLSEKEFVVMANRDNSNFRFGTTKVIDATVGYFKDGKWVAKEDATIKGNRVVLDEYQVVKVTLK